MECRLSQTLETGVAMLLFLYIFYVRLTLQYKPSFAFAISTGNVQCPLRATSLDSRREDQSSVQNNSVHRVLRTLLHRGYNDIDRSSKSTVFSILLVLVQIQISHRQNSKDYRCRDYKLRIQ